MRRLVFCLPYLAALAGCRSAVVLSPPGQPADGPGGADYPHGSAVAERFGAGADEYWIATPADPVPHEAPMVAFLHAWSAVDPRLYGAWIRHTARKGYIVVYPRYQDSLLTVAADLPAVALRAVSSAHSHLLSDGPVRPAAEGMAWVGHSLGAIIAANLAVSSVGLGLPPPSILMAVTPGGEARLAVADLSGLPPATLVLLVEAEDDRVASEGGVNAIRAALTRWASDTMERITIRSDSRPAPPLLADHVSPLAWSGFPSAVEDGGQTASLRDRRNAARFAPDALDFFGYWKLFDGLLDAAFHGRNREYALGDTPQQRFMGLLSDGQPVTPLSVE